MEDACTGKCHWAWLGPVPLTSSSTKLSFECKRLILPGIQCFHSQSISVSEVLSQMSSWWLNPSRGRWFVTWERSCPHWASVWAGLGGCDPLSFGKSAAQVTLGCGFIHWAVWCPLPCLLWFFFPLSSFRCSCTHWCRQWPRAGQSRLPPLACLPMESMRFGHPVQPQAGVGQGLLSQLRPGFWCWRSRGWGSRMRTVRRESRWLASGLCGLSFLLISMSVWSDQISHHKDNRILLLSAHSVLVAGQVFKILMSVPSFLPSTHPFIHPSTHPSLYTSSYLVFHPQTSQWEALCIFQMGRWRFQIPPFPSHTAPKQ